MFTDNQWDQLNSLTGALTTEELIEYFGDTLEDREIAFVIWDVRDFEAEIKANFPEIPVEHRATIAKLAYGSARAELADTRESQKISDAIDSAWNDFNLSRQALSRFKIRFRNPAIKSSIEAVYIEAEDAGKALTGALDLYPRYAGWNVASVSVKR